MRLMRHTLMKDARRLWPLAAVTCLLLAALANADRWRSDWMVSPMEGWLNLLLSWAWACLAALAVLEDPLVGDRHIWMTRPHRWAALLGAKLAFAVLAIHVPGFLADAFVLSARGFAPLLYLGELLTKQLLFFACVILPAIAIATVVRSFPHFIIVLFIVAAGLAVLNGGVSSRPEITPAAGDLRHGLVRVLLACTAVVVVCMQYARRAGLAARIAGLLGGLAAAAVFAYMPIRAEYAAHGSGAHVALRNATPDALPRWPGGANRQHTVHLPIVITPAAPSATFRVPFVEVEVVALDGSVLRSVRPTPNRPFEKIDLMAYTYSAAHESPPDWLVLTFSNSAWQRFQNARVRIRGSAGLELYRQGETTSMPVDGSREIPGVGRCTAGTVNDRVSESLLKVVCESPRDVPASYVTLRHGASQRVWRQGLNWAMTYSPSPNRTWLSPIERAQSFFRMSETVETAPGSQWLVPASYLSSAHIEITPVFVTGRDLATFEFGDVTLSATVTLP